MLQCDSLLWLRSGATSLSYDEYCSLSLYAAAELDSLFPFDMFLDVPKEEDRVKLAFLVPTQQPNT